tara:strand:+ start:3494 stop:4081 length:588 start_codon:yes stop_codon:yes gene_type:complete
MTKLIELFPKCLYVQDNVCTDQLNDLETAVYDLKNNTVRSPLLNVDTSHSRIKDLQTKKPFDILSKEIITHARSYMREYGYRNTKNAFIENLWFNISGKSDYLFPHAHHGSFLSGVFYIKTQPDNAILFYNENKNYYEFPETVTKFSETIKGIPCKKGRLIIFSSDFHHSTPPQKSEGDKVAISFNISLEKKNEF